MNYKTEKLLRDIELVRSEYMHNDIFHSFIVVIKSESIYKVIDK